MRKVFIISLIIALAACQTYSTTMCQCSQLLSDGDCLKNSDCAWDTTKKVCATATTPVTPVETYATYCQDFSETDCPKAKPCETCGTYSACQWLDNKCSHFTGCTAHQKTTDGECQAISNRCITDGIHCVELGTCDSYLKQQPCVKNSSGRFCYWNTTDNKCEDASTCDKLPVTLNTDTLCRAQLSTCTTTATGGCVDSGTGCADQKIEAQCVWNKLMSQACYWTGTECKDKICDNAPLTMVTDDACKNYVSTCTTKQGGGCITRTTCANAGIQAACVKSSGGVDCYWNGTQCLDKICGNAPTTMTTNAACAGFKSNCITKNGGGCVDNGNCLAANIAAACVKNIYGVDCIFDNNICKEKTCTNAPTTNNTHELCQSFLSSCTVKTGGGCQPKSCSNAPTSYTSNTECENYLPKNNCIAKLNGGCETLSSCTSITLEANCVKDVSGSACIFNGSCKYKTCGNSLAANDTHELCQSYLSSCTAVDGRCVDKTCENSLTEAICTTDLNNRACQWKGKCFSKQCAFAPSGITSASECRDYKPYCTLSNTGYGCIDMPLRCEAFISEATCSYRRNVSGDSVSVVTCGWNGTTCVDRSCATASKLITDHDGCSAQSMRCVLSNTGNGCQDIPTTCGARKLAANCAVGYALGDPICVWNANTNTCLDKSCATANMDGVVGKIDAVNSGNCSSYYGCLVSNDGTSGCIAKPASCAGLSEANCGDNSKIGGSCVYVGGQCKDLTCVNLTYDTQEACSAKSCAMKNDESGCQPFQALCSAYTLSENCIRNASNKPCKWNSSTSKCEETTCLDAPQTIAYNTNEACAAYSNSSGICTLQPRIEATGGCAQKYATCAEYKSQAACHKTLGNTGASDDCQWDALQGCIVAGGGGGGLTPIPILTCSQITSQTYSDLICAASNPSCKANGDSSACTEKVCADYSSGIETNSQCSDINELCVINNGGATRTCQAIANVCTEYDTAVKCTFSETGPCVWDTDCQAVGSTVDCTKFKGTDDHCQEYSDKCKGADSAGNNVACVQKGCDDYSGYLIGWSGCQAISNTCSVDMSLYNCIDKQDACTGYDSEAKCIRISDTGFCNWTGGSCVSFTDQECSTIGNTNADTMCDYKSAGRCTYQRMGGGCQTKESLCSAYDSEERCTFSQQGKCFYNASLAAGSRCLRPTTPAECVQIVTYGLSPSQCKIYYSGCTVNRTETACQAEKATCDLYSATECAMSTAGQCVQTQALNSGASCVLLTDSMTCAQIFPGEGLANHDYCNYLRYGCTNNGANACAEKTCANATNVPQESYTASICQNWKSGCIPNNSNTGCQNKPATCAEQTVAACTLSTEGFCHVVNNKCTLKSCSQADPATNTTHANCETFLSTCTIARPGGCQARTACNAYVSEGQCKFNTTGAECHWNVIGKACVDKKCDNYEAASFDTAIKCEAKGCVIKASAPGCQNRGTCSSYNEAQCTATSRNSSNGSCVWNTNLETPTCQDKSCATAPNTYASVNECSEYFSGCTVAATIDPATNAVTYAGCIPKAACNTYVGEDQCTFNSSGSRCGWNGEKCDDYSCLTAPAADHTTHEACSEYLSECTVDSTLVGCIPIPDKCEGMIQEQCLYDSNGKECYWVEDSSSCITKTCDNAPSTISDAAGCEEYLSGCTMFDDVKCKTKICEDYVFTTDALCKGAMSTCTSDGTKCVLRGTCAQALSQAGCVTAVNGLECEWLTTSAGASYCTTKNCTTAPITLTSESQCASYYAGCTTKNNGGCVVKSTCAAANVQSACTKSSLGVECAWDVDKCRDKDCQDFNGKTHAECKTQRSNCTAGLNGKCARLSTCENASVRAACVEGMNGPCLWIGGACYSYTSCQSLTWPSNYQCKQISSQCTTNGTKCVGITSCAETNVNGGCVTGYDGECIQSVPSLDSTDTKCKLYTSCADAFYLTHVQCQTASYKCTTNKQTGCIPLAGCSTYTNDESCKINDKGAVSANNKVTSTGYCTWDTTASSCRDQVCSDLIYTTHPACNSTLSTCTSDGTACLNQGNCATYTTDAACNNGVGLDGVCFWVAQNGATPASCRLKTCDDIQNGTSNSVCSLGLSSCISDGTKCIPYSTCSSYKTQASCNSGGSDGTCVWKSTTTGTITTGSCSLMTSCASASSDQNACNAARFKCSWTPAVTGTKPAASKCETHTCTSYQQANGSCSRFFSWDSKLQQVCTTVNGVCQATDPATLAQSDCYSSAITGYAYTWNAATSKCGVCTSAPVTTNNTTNTTNNTTTTESGQIVSIFIMALSYILI